MKIIFLSWTAAFGGGEKHLVDLVQRLDLSKVQPAIFCFGVDPFSRIVNDRLQLGIDVEKGLSRTSFFRTWSKFRKQRPDVVVFVTGSVGAYPWYTFLAARMAGARRVYAIHHMFSDIPGPVSKNGNMLVYLARRAFGWRVRHTLESKIVGALTDRSICVSEKLREDLIGSYGFTHDKTVTVHNGVDFMYYSTSDPRGTTLRGELGISRDDVVLVSACRLVKEKGLHILLQAMSMLRDDMPVLKSIILGEGPCSMELQQACTNMGLSSKVFFVGFKDPIRPYLQAGDILVNPSYFEGLPLAVLEAMACGLPCIASNVGGVPEIISDQRDGLLVTPGSVGELSAAIRRLASDRAERKRMGELAREKVRLKFDLDRCVEELKSILLQ
jgi:glycosyltransferase involved in cell wall biosynthesis